MHRIARAGEVDPEVAHDASGVRGSWIVEGPCNCCGGIFVSREAALEFVRRERRAMDEVSRHACFAPTEEVEVAPVSAAVRLVNG